MLKPPLILASASPRRAELLDQIGVRYRVAPAAIDERQQSGELAEDYVRRMASDKARVGYSRQSGALAALGADTAVIYQQQVFGKPTDINEATYMLGLLSGKTHDVLSAVAIDNGISNRVLITKTAVTFRIISPRECLSYWQTGEPVDKAGGYAIQGRAAVFVTHLEGSYSGVVGLPLAETETLLKEFAIPVWQV